MGLRNFLKLRANLLTGLIVLALCATSPVLAQSELAPAVYSAAYKTAAYYSLLFILFCVFIVVIGKVFKLHDLNSELQGKKSKANWNKINGALFGVFLIAGLFGTYWSYSVHGVMSHSVSASVHGDDIDSMFNVTLIITTIVFVLTHIALFGFAIKYPNSKKKKAYFYPHNNTLERWWTIVPAIVLTYLVVLGFFTWKGITEVPEDEQKKALSIEVTGQQYNWTIRYSGADNKVGARNYKKTTAANGLGIDFSDNASWDDKMADEIVIPVNQPVRFTINAKDVLHSFYMPAFRVQVNAVPGMPTHFQFTPKYTTEEMRIMKNDPKYNYLLLCAKICGSGHWNMQKNVRVVSAAEYQDWLAQQQLYYNDDVKMELQMAQKSVVGDNKLALK